MPESRSISQRALGVTDMPADEIAQHVGPPRIVSDDAVGDALRWLTENAEDIGQARKRLAQANALVKHVEALLFLSAPEKGTVDYKKAWVRTQQRWLEASDEEAIAAGEFEKLRAAREAAVARIDAWRSETASLRAAR